MMDLNYITQHIEEFASFINTRSIDRIIQEMNLSDSPYSIKYMVRHTTGGSLQDIVTLIYSYNLLVGVSIVKDKEITSQEQNMNGIDINKYLPKNQSFKDDECPSIQRIKNKTNLLKELNVPYDNDLTLTEKLDLLDAYVESQKPEPKQVKEFKTTESHRKSQRERQKRWYDKHKAKTKSDYDWMKKDKE